MRSPGHTADNTGERARWARPVDTPVDRRNFLKAPALGGTACTIGTGWLRLLSAAPGPGPCGPLTAYANGIQLSPRSRLGEPSTSPPPLGGDGYGVAAAG